MTHKYQLFSAVSLQLHCALGVFAHSPVECFRGSFCLCYDWYDVAEAYISVYGFGQDFPGNKVPKWSSLPPPPLHYWPTAAAGSQRCVIEWLYDWYQLNGREPETNDIKEIN